jgi:hypothetical protein
MGKLSLSHQCCMIPGANCLGVDIHKCVRSNWCLRIEIKPTVSGHCGDIKTSRVELKRQGFGHNFSSTREGFDISTEIRSRGFNSLINTTSLFLEFIKIIP